MPEIAYLHMLYKNFIPAPKEFNTLSDVSIKKKTSKANDLEFTVRKA
jgi:hypothetical protein